MSYKDCVDAIKKASGELFDDKTAKELLTRISESKRVKKLKGLTENLDKALYEDEMNRLVSKRTQLLIEKRNKILNEVIAQKNYTAMTEGPYKTPVDGMTKLIKKSSSESKGLYDGLLRTLDTELSRENVKAEFWNRDHAIDIAKELQQLNTKGGNVGMTQNTSAIKIAKVIKKIQDYTRGRKNRAGAMVSNLDGYITKQSWDQELVRKAGFEAWKDRMLTEMSKNLGKIFDGMDSDDINKALKESYNNIISGIHSKQTLDGDFITGFKGPGNLAKKTSQHRVFHFNDAEAWMRINDEFGQRSLHGTFLSELQNSAKTISLLENFGTNPENMYNALSLKVKRDYADTPQIVKSIDGHKNTSMFKSMMGELSNPENMTLYKISDFALKWNMITKLGSSTISALTDLPTKISELTAHGVNPLHAYWQTLSDSFRQFGADKEMAEYFLAGLEGYQSQFVSKIMDDDLQVGKMSEMTRMFFKLNLLEQWTDNHKAGFIHMLSNNLGQNSGKEFAQLSPKLQNMFKLYDITDKDWNIIRKTVHTSESGTRYILTDKVNEILDQDISKALGLSSESQIAKYRDELTTKLQNYYSNSVDYAVITPDIEDRYYHTLGTKRGTILGEAVRQFMQFKSFPLAVANRMWQRSNMTGDIGHLGLIATVAHMSLMGYAAMSIKDMLRGKTPRDPSSPDTIFAAITQGGGFGIYGDFLFGNYSRFGQSPLATIGGPTVGTLSDLVVMLSSGIRGKWKEAGQTGVNLIKGNTPMINLFYTRMALDYLIYNNLQEMVSPGYLSRMESNTIKKKQRYFIPPTRVNPSGYGNQNILERVGASAENLSQVVTGQ